MKEDFLHFIWENRLFFKNNLKSSDNENIEILNIGIKNNDAGADFFNAKIKIEDRIWAGNIEIHIKSSDWEHHKHHQNKAYNNVILQVVFQNDKDVFHESGEKVRTLILNFDEKIFQNFQQMLASKKWIPCEKKIQAIESFEIKFWLNRIFFERLETKSQIINNLLNQNKNSWEESFYQYLSNNFGQKTNSQPFEMLAKSLPLKYLAKQKDNLLQIEAMLFGQAGFLNENIDNEYYIQLKKEYVFLQKKYNLKPLEKHVWKFLRLRPSNFPTVRIAQFANLIHKSNKLFSKILEITNIQEIENLFSISASEFWDTHYNFEKESSKKKKTIGKSTIDNILINTIIHFIFAYGKFKNSEKFIERSISFAEKINAEKNSMIDKWKEIGINPQNSLESQALIHLKNEYCQKEKCTNCRFGNLILKQV